MLTEIYIYIYTHTYIYIYKLGMFEIRFILYDPISFFFLQFFGGGKKSIC